MVDGNEVRLSFSLFEGFSEPARLLARNFCTVARVHQNQAQVVAKIERGVTLLGIQSAEERHEKRRILLLLVISTANFVVSETGYEGNQPPLAVDHRLGIVANEHQGGVARGTVVVAEVAADEGEHRVLSRGDTVVGDNVRIDAAIAAGDEVKCFRRLRGHRPKAIRRRGESDREFVFGAGRETGQLTLKDGVIGWPGVFRSVGFDGSDLLSFRDGSPIGFRFQQRRIHNGERGGFSDGANGPRRRNFFAVQAKADRRVGRVFGTANPRHCHRRRGIALPGEKERVARKWSSD